MRKVLRFYRRRQHASEHPNDMQINEEEIDIWKIEGGGFLFAVLKKMFVLIDRYVSLSEDREQSANC